MTQVLSLDSIRAKRQTLRNEVDADRAKLDVKLRDLADLDAAEAFVVRFGEEAVSVDSPTVAEARLPLAEAEQRNPGKPLKKRELIATILAQSPNPWMTAVEIRARANSLTGKDLKMTSISPMLSDMKGAGLIIRDEFKVALSARIHENEAPNGKAAGASEVEEGAASSIDDPAHAPG